MQCFCACPVCVSCACKQAKEEGGMPVAVCGVCAWYGKKPKRTAHKGLFTIASVVVLPPSPVQRDSRSASLSHVEGRACVALPVVSLQALRTSQVTHTLVACQPGCARLLRRGPDHHQATGTYEAKGRKGRRGLDALHNSLTFPSLHHTHHTGLCQSPQAKRPRLDMAAADEDLVFHGMSEIELRQWVEANLDGSMT